MAALPQCDAFGFIWDPDGSPDVDKLVIVLKVVDATGNPISFEQRQTFTDDTGTYHFTLPRNATVTLTARASGIFADDAPVTFVVPDAPTGELILSFPPDSLTVTPPLTWSSNNLGILKATSTQDGYLAAADYVRFNSFSTAAKVDSFNGRTGTVLPVATDYQGFYLGLGGGVLTGPLTLAADPATAMEATTRQYVDARFAEGVSGVATFNGRTGAVLPVQSDYAVFTAPVQGMVPAPITSSGKYLRDDATWQTVSTRFPGSVWLTDYNASGSSNRYSGSMANGSTILTTTAATDFAVGQGILVKGAGTGGADLVSKITALAGTSITLQNAASTTITAVANNVQHDDTAAFQSALDSVFAAGGGTIYVPDGFYRLNGPFNSINSIVRIPYNATFPGPTTLVSISIIGLNQPFPSFSGVPSTKGAVFQTDKIGPSGGHAMIAAALFDATTDIPPTSNVTVYMEHLTWRTYQQPQISAVDMGMAGNALFRNVVIDTATALQDINLPPTGYFGLRTPRVNTGMAMDTFDNCYVLGYGIGAIIAEQFRSTWFSVMRCGIGMQADFNYHPAMHVTGLVWHCPIGVKFSNRMSVDFVLDIEASFSGWDTLVYDFQDAGNMATGWIKYSKVAGGAGDLYLATVQGCANLTLINLNALGDTFKTPATFKDLTATGTTQLKGVTDIYDGSAMQPLSVDANDTSGSGYRRVRVPNPGAADTTPPGILTGPTAGSITATGATITWTTDEASSSQVDYGTSTSYGTSTPLNSALVTNHSVSISGLSASTPYHYRVKSADAASNLLTSGDFTFTTTAASGTVDLLSNLVSMWKMDESSGTANRVDSGGGGNNLTVLSNVPSGTGKISLAAHFPGNGNRLSGANNSSLQTGPVDYTFALWVNIDTLADGDFVSKAGALSSGGEDEYIIGYVAGATPATTGKFRFVVQGGGTYATVYSASLGPPVLNTWYLIVAWHNQGSGTINIQVNDGGIDTFSPVPPLITGGNGLYFGSYGDGMSNYVHALVDEAAFWKGRFLDADDRTALYAGGSGLPFGSWT